MKTASATRIAGLEANLGALSSRIETYEKLEEELDRTVLQAGALTLFDRGDERTRGDEPHVDEALKGSSPSAMGDVPSARGARAGGGAMMPFIRVPSSSQRRMEQCLGLASDLLAAQKRAEAAEVSR